MNDIRIKKLASNLLNHSINIQSNENLLVELLGIEGLPLAKELIKQAESMNVKVFFNINFGDVP